MALSLDPAYPAAKSKTSFQDGLEYQDFVCLRLARQGIILQNIASKNYQLTVGENLQGFEIKLDQRCTETRRLSIEVAEKSRPEVPGWTDSGILKHDNAWLYIQGNYEVIFVFPKNLLVRYVTAKKPEIIEKLGTIKTFYLPWDVAVRNAALVIDCTSGNGQGR